MYLLSNIYLQQQNGIQSNDSQIVAFLNNAHNLMYLRSNKLYAKLWQCSRWFSLFMNMKECKDGIKTKI